MKATWEKIEAWLVENAPKALADLRPPATPQALTELQESLGFPVPVELREWLSVHDGQPPDSLVGMLDGWIFLGAGQIAEAHRTFTGLLAAGDFAGRPAVSRDGLARPVWWSGRWVPFLDGPGGDYLVIDVDPTEKGREGQVVTFWHDYGARKVKAESLSALMGTFLADLEAGAYEVSRKGGLKPG
jgi:cell wall assembly regulator SMI1